MARLRDATVFKCLDDLIAVHSCYAFPIQLRTRVGVGKPSTRTTKRPRDDTIYHSSHGTIKTSKNIDHRLAVNKVPACDVRLDVRFVFTAVGIRVDTEDGAVVEVVIDGAVEATFNDVFASVDTVNVGRMVDVDAVVGEALDGKAVDGAGDTS